MIYAAIWGSVLLFLGLCFIIGVREGKKEKPQSPPYSRLPDPADSWTAADWEAYNYHSDAGDR